MMQLIKYGLFLMLVLSLSAIPLNVRAKDSPIKVKTIIVNNYHPYTFMNDKGGPDGFSVEIARAVTRAMDLELDIRPDKWDQAMKELEGGSIDLLPMMAYSPERDKIFDFSVPHTIAYDAIFLKKETIGIESLKDLTGKTVIVMNKDIAHSYLLSSGLSKTMTLNLVDSLPEALKQLSEGKGDAAIMPKLVGILTLKKLSLLNIKPSFLIDRYTRPFSFAVKDGNQLLLERLNQGLSIIKSTRQYDAIYKKWFGALEDPYEHLKIAMKYGSIAALILLGFIIWNVLLNRQVRRKTRELNQSNKELTEQGELLASIINGTTDAVYIKDTLGHYTVVNDAVVRLFAKPLSDIIGHDDTRFFSLEEARILMSGDKTIMESGKVVTKEEYITTLGSRKVYLATKGPIHDESGKVAGLFGISRDITGIKQTQEEIRRLNNELEQRVIERTAQLESANRELDAFCYSVSHDLRAPLRHMDGFVNLLVTRCRDSLNEKGLHYVDIIASSARQMGVLIDDLLQFSRTGRMEIRQEKMDMNQAVKETLTLLKNSYTGRSIEWVIADLPVVRGDYALIRQVWANLLENSVKYTRTRQDARIEVCSYEEKGEYIFVVSDNGVGFDMQYVHKLFGVFQRLHSQEEFEGTGIGLATVQRIVKRHSGRIWVEAELNQGARFYFSLPK